MDERTRLGQRVKRLRRLKGYPQEQLAERIAINPQYLSRIERGAENPTLDLLLRLAMGRQVDLYALFPFDPDAAQPQRLRRKLEGLVAEIRAEELSRVGRILEALVHGAPSIRCITAPLPSPWPG